MSNIEQRISWHQVFMKMLHIIKLRSTCLKIKTAAMIVCNTQIISFGYNGTFTKCTECDTHWNEVYKVNYPESKLSFDEWCKTDEFKLAHRQWSACNEIHAESNALCWFSKHHWKKACVMYCIYSPCDTCTKEIINYKDQINTIYYEIKYSRGDNALKRLEQAGITCIKL